MSLQQFPDDNPFRDVEAGQARIVKDTPVASNDRQRDEQNKIAVLQADVAEVSGILQQNLNKLFDRGQQLDQLESQSERLSVQAQDFQVISRKVSRKMWWKNIKLMLILSGVGITILVVIIVVATR